MFSFSDDLTLVHHEDPIHVTHRRETMSDDDSRSPNGGILHCFLDQHLVYCIEARGCFVENEDPRIFDECSGNADALAFSSGESYAILADPGIPLVRETVVEPVDA